MIKKLAIIISVMTIPVVLHCMDTVIPLKNLKRSKTADQGSQSRRPEEPENKQDVRLNLDTIPEPLFSASNGKPSIKNLKQVNHLKNTQDTYRVSTGRGSNETQKEKRVNNDNRGTKKSNDLHQPFRMNDTLNILAGDDEEDTIPDIHNNSGMKRRSMLQDLSLDNSFSPQDMWDMLKKANPKLYDHARTNQLSLDEVMNCPYDFDAINPQVHNLLNQLAKKKQLPLAQMMEYVHLLENFNIEPEALGQLVQTQHNLSDDHMGLLVSKFKGIQKNNPEQYLSLALDFITRTCNDDGLKEPSPLHATHVAIQNKEITSQKGTITYQYVALAASVFLSLAGYGWAIYGQVTGTTNPTQAPTTAPTYMPTGSPT